MADHLRARIRTAIAGALTGLPTTGARVYASRVYPLEVADLPALMVFAISETTETATLNNYIARRLHIVVRAFAQANADLDDLLDQICKEIEIALATPCAALAGLAQSITLTGTTLDLSGAADKPTGQATLSYEILYYTAENAPDVLV